MTDPGPDAVETADGGSGDLGGGDAVAVDPHIYGRPGGGDGAAGGGGGPRGRRRLRRRPWRIAVLVIVLLGVAFVVAVFLWVSSEASPSGPPGAEVVVAVSSGSGVDQVAGTLEAKQVIGSSLAFRIWSQFHSIPGVESGSYAFRRNSSFATVNAILGTGPNVFPVTIPPGFTVSELAQRVGQVPGHTAGRFRWPRPPPCIHRGSPPGRPTSTGSSARGPIVVFPAETDHHAARRDDRPLRHPRSPGRPRRRAGRTSGYTPYQVITVASIVEKEGVYAQNLGRWPG